MKAAPGGSAHKRAALLVRGHYPTAAAAARVATYASDLQAAPESERWHLWVSLDATKDPAVALRATDMLKDAWAAAGLDRNALRLHLYTEADMVSAYPVLDEEMRESAALLKCNELTSGKYSLAWGFHCEAINLWYQALPEEDTYDQVWVIEDDVGFSGNIADLFRRFEGDSADLLTAEPGPVEEEWFWADTVSAAYAERIPLARRRKCGEHVQRLSRRFLRELHRLSADMRITGWSEQSTPTLCDWLEDCQVKNLPADVLGSVYSWDGRVEEEEWNTLLSDASPGTKNRFYHALKW